MFKSYARVLAITAAISGNAVAIPFTNEAAFQAAAPGFQLENFDSFAIGTAITTLPSLGITFQVLADGPPTIVAGQGSTPRTAPNSLQNRPLGSGSTQPIRFSASDNSLITAVGIWNTTSDDQLILRLLDGNNILLESLIVNPQPAPQFGGIVSSAGATTVEVAWTGLLGNGLHGFDDLQVELRRTVRVPEPGSIALVSFGLMAIGFATSLRSSKRRVGT